jgi:hypothetical protein
LDFYFEGRRPAIVHLQLGMIIRHVFNRYSSAPGAFSLLIQSIYAHGSCFSSGHVDLDSIGHRVVAAGARARVASVTVPLQEGG